MTKLSRKIRNKKGKIAQIKNEKQISEASKYHNDPVKWRKAEQIYKTILFKNPRNHAVLSRLATLLLLNTSDQQKPLELILKAINLESNNIGYQNILTAIYFRLGKWTEVIGTSKKILSKDLANAEANYYIGYALQALGKLDECVPFFQKTLTEKPDHFFSHLELCSTYYKLQKYDLLINQLEVMKEQGKRTSDTKTRASFNISIGKYYDLIDEYDLAFKYLEIGNELIWNDIDYDFHKVFQEFKAVAEFFDRDHMNRNVSFGQQDSSPIFIVGMPRSGTTLVEQIIGSHPLISPGGELYDFENLIRDYQFNVPSDYMNLGKKYLEGIQRYKQGASYVTDKMPINFKHIGFIRRALPNAKIINCIRDPRDTCFSCYKQIFNQGYGFSYNLETLGKYYILYQRLMKHWHDVAPGFVFDVKYENLVDKPERETRKILDYCQVNWSDSCLEYYKNDRHIKTHSRDQATKPIFKSSVMRWKNYEEHLRPLIEVLGEIL